MTYGLGLYIDVGSIHVAFILHFATFPARYSGKTVTCIPLRLFFEAAFPGTNRNVTVRAV